MEMPPVHMCAFLSEENQRLKEKITELKRQRRELYREINRKTSDQLRSCTISCQTDIEPSHRVTASTSQVRTLSDENAHLQRLLRSQNELLRKYQLDESSDRGNPQGSTKLIEDYERRLRQSELEKQQAEQRAKQVEDRLRKMEERYERMRQEMSVLDENFFEELEDLKYSLQQANNLNREYEKTVQMLSARLGIPYPKVEARK